MALAQKEAIANLPQEELQATDESIRGGDNPLDERGSEASTSETTRVPATENNEQDTTMPPRNYGKIGPRQINPPPAWVTGGNAVELEDRLRALAGSGQGLPGVDPGRHANDQHQDSDNVLMEQHDQELDEMLMEFRDQPASFYRALPVPWNVVPDRPVRAQDAHKMARAVEESTLR